MWQLESPWLREVLVRAIARTLQQGHHAQRVVRLEPAQIWSTPELVTAYVRWRTEALARSAYLSRSATASLNAAGSSE